MNQFVGGIIEIIVGILVIIFQNSLTKVRMLHGEHWSPKAWKWVGIICVIVGVIFILLSSAGINVTN